VVLFFRHNLPFKGAFACHLGSHHEFYVETMATIMAIEFDASNNRSKLWLETNSQLLVHAFTHPTIVHWTLYTKWMNCMKFKVNYKLVFVSGILKFQEILKV